jgi:hypothetical protein
MSYESPKVVDYGSLKDVTAAATLGGPEDGNSKDVEQHHSFPI